MAEKNGNSEEAEKARLKKSLEKMSPETARDYRKLDKEAAGFLGLALGAQEENGENWVFPINLPKEDPKKK